MEHDDDGVTGGGTVWCIVAVALDPHSALAALTADDYSRGVCDVQRVADGMLEEFKRSGPGFGHLNVRRLLRYGRAGFPLPIYVCMCVCVCVCVYMCVCVCIYIHIHMYRDSGA